jgi:hypothetical protein
MSMVSHRRPATPQRVLLFLDFDGVLHAFPAPAARADRFCHLARLEAVLLEFPEIVVVISSTWRLDYPLDALLQLFSTDVRHRVIGVLPEMPIAGLADVAGSRHREIVDYLRGDSNAVWIALDDDATLFPVETLQQVILCDDGFRDKQANLLRDKVVAMRVGLAPTEPSK